MENRHLLQLLHLQLLLIIDKRKCSEISRFRQSVMDVAALTDYKIAG
jgi:hypothetical protein